MNAGFIAGGILGALTGLLFGLLAAVGYVVFLMNAYGL